MIAGPFQCITCADTPKEVMYGWYGPAFMARNYSVLFFDGPGQGLTPRRPPYMPFYPAVGGWVGGWVDGLLLHGWGRRYACRRGLALAGWG